MNTKPANAFSPEYISQIEPFRYINPKKPLLAPLPSLDSIKSDEDFEAEAKRFHALRPRT